MFNWLRELFDILETRNERLRHCVSCDTLRMENERLRHDNSLLLHKIVSPTVAALPEPVEQKVSLPRALPWNARKQLLEAEDRERAKLMKQAPQPQSTGDLEKELDIAAQERENASK